MFQEKFQEVRQRIEAACLKAGRAPSEVSLLPVTKKVEPERIREAAACGLRVFGESRVQEARQKAPLCPAHIEWHLIGHLQTNKVRDAVALFRMMHAVDSLRLLAAIDAACAAAGTSMKVCVEVNNSGESTKYGLKPDEVPALLEAGGKMLHVELVGLMTIPPLTEDPEEARPFFCGLRELRDQWRTQTGLELPELSMGMSNDFEVAVEEGATWVRLGTLLFGGRDGHEDK